MSDLAAPSGLAPWRWGLPSAWVFRVEGGGRVVLSRRKVLERLGKTSCPPPPPPRNLNCQDSTAVTSPPPASRTSTTSTAAAGTRSSPAVAPSPTPAGAPFASSSTLPPPLAATAGPSQRPVAGASQHRTPARSSRAEEWMKEALKNQANKVRSFVSSSSQSVIKSVEASYILILN